MTRVALRVAYSDANPAPEITCSGCGSRELQAASPFDPKISRRTPRAARRSRSSTRATQGHFAKAASSS
jgi:hypothetical protein